MSARRISASAFFLLAAVALAEPVAGQATATTTVDTTHVTVGDRITLTVTVDHPNATGVIWPDSLDLSPFEVLARSTSGPVTSDARSRSTIVLTLAAFELGELEIPSFDMVITADGGTEETVTSNPVGIEVASVGVDESGDIRDIRGPFTIPLGTLRLLLWVLLPLLLVVLLWVIARRLRARDGDVAAPALGALPRPAHVVALEALDALDAAGMLERGQVKEYHIEASEILRAYVGARFGVGAPEMTTHEVLGALTDVGADPRFRDGLGVFLEQCDLVKFAKVRPGHDASRQALMLGRRIVQESVPAPEPAAATAAGASEAA